jgi:hypothetical protein
VTRIAHYRRLMTEARLLAIERGHLPAGASVTYDANDVMRGTSVCLRCKGSVHVVTSPQGERIYGDAIDTDCKGEDA